MSLPPRPCDLVELSSWGQRQETQEQSDLQLSFLAVPVDERILKTVFPQSKICLSAMKKQLWNSSVFKLTTTPSRTFLGRGLALKFWGFSSSSWGFFVACLSWSLFSISSSKPSGTVGSFTAGFFRSSALSSIFLFSSSALILKLRLKANISQWSLDQNVTLSQWSDPNVASATNYNCSGKNTSHQSRHFSILASVTVEAAAMHILIHDS